jgi:disulfide bond formation protein DsbB
MKLFTPRLMYFYAFTSIIVMFAIAFYLQFWKGVAPCPLCLLQRIVLGIIGILFFLGMAFKFKKIGSIILGLLGFLFSIGGALLAGRQVWIQHLPPNQSMDCGASLQYMLHVLPPDEVLKKIFEGTAECSIVDWSLWGLSMAELSLIWFIAFAIFALFQIVRTK